MSTLTVATATLLAEAPQDARILRLDLHLRGGGDPRTPPADWRPTHPMDNPANEPDLWIADLTEPTIWCKADKHPNTSGNTMTLCDWCGHLHQDEMTVYTFMLPSDY